MKDSAKQHTCAQNAALVMFSGSRLYDASVYSNSVLQSATLPCSTYAHPPALHGMCPHQCSVRAPLTITLNVCVPIYRITRLFCVWTCLRSFTVPIPTRFMWSVQAELSESQKYHETLEEEMGRLKVKLDQRGVDLLLLQGELQHAQEAASRQAAALAAKDAQLNATG